jgi:hypothetical protein
MTAQIRHADLGWAWPGIAQDFASKQKFFD